MAELTKANEGNTFWQQFMKPQPEAIEYKPITGEIERALNGLHPDTGTKKPELTKKEIEMGKIKALDMQLAHMTREQRKKKIEKSIRPGTQQEDDQASEISAKKKPVRGNSARSQRSA